MFKGLFRNFGHRLLSRFVDHLKRLVEDDNDSSQRCAAEIIAGVIRGAKHWSFSSTEDTFQNVLVPLIRSGLANVSVEAIGDWGTCFATASDSRDPNRIHWIMDVLMEEPIRSKGSFIDSSRLYALQGGIAQQEWRVGELCHRLNEFLKPFLTHPFKNVRDRLGSVLANIFMSDLEFVLGVDNDKGAQLNGISSNKRNPKVVDFINEVLPQLEIMSQEPEDTTSILEGKSIPPQNGVSEMQSKTNEMIELLKKMPSENMKHHVLGSGESSIPPDKLASLLIAKNAINGNEITSAGIQFSAKQSVNSLDSINSISSPKLPVFSIMQNSSLVPTSEHSEVEIFSEQFGKRQVAIRLLQTGKVSQYWR